MRQQLQPVFAGRAEDTTEENIQARLRGVILMALSNKFGSLLLTTGNKSELAVGYCTLYGDMCGGLAVISDVPKTMVYRLAKWINREREIIPARVHHQTALRRIAPRPDRPGQPAALRNARRHPGPLRCRRADRWAKSSQLGFDEATVKRVIRLIDFNEYKRRQAAPGLKVTTKAFGVGRRFPIAQRYREG